MKLRHAIGRWLVLGLFLPFLGSGCGSIGPKKISRDRLDYSFVLAESWKKQMLLNIVKVRYLELPIFLDVGQLVSGYSMETSVNLGGNLTPAGGLGSLGASGRYTDRPTITYLPLTGEKFLEGFLTPIKPVNVFSLVQSGYAADFVLELCLDSFNGLHNRPARMASSREPDPEFFRVLQLMREVQDVGGFGIRIRPAENGEPTFVIFFRKENVPEEIRSKGEEIRRLLQIPLDQAEFELVYSPMRGEEGELGIGTRSLWQILAAMSMGIVIPESHHERELVPPLGEIGENEIALLRVLSGPDEPKHAYVAVPFEEEWFWIADNDWRSKRTFSSILFLFTLADTRGTESLPTITIPTF